MAGCRWNWRSSLGIALQLSESIMFKWIIPTLVAVLSGVIILIGTLIPNSPVAEYRGLLIEWATLLGAFAMLIAYTSVIRANLSAIKEKKPSRISNGIVMVSALLTLLIIVVFGESHPVSTLVFSTILVPGNSALFALTAITLITAGMRIFGTRRDMQSLVFIVSAVITLFAAVPLGIGLIDTLMAWVDTIALAGMRGVLIGVILGVILAGIRVIMGFDRSHSQE